jgi:hypothetical protein
VQVLLPAALCFSVSVVQAGGRVVARTAYGRLPAYNPLGALRPTGRIALFLSVVSIPHTTAGCAAVLCVLAACATWATTLNVAFIGVLACVAWHWAHPRPAAEPPAAAPLLSKRATTALTSWVVFQLTATYAVQIPEARRAAGAPALAWLNLGVFRESAPLRETLLLAAHIAAVAALYLALIALRCTHDAETRLWPQPTDVLDAVRASVAAERRQRAEMVQEQVSFHAAHRTSFATPRRRQAQQAQPDDLHASGSAHDEPAHATLLHEFGMPGQWMGSTALAEPPRAPSLGFGSPETPPLLTARDLEVESTQYSEAPPAMPPVPALAGAVLMSIQAVFKQPAALACAIAVFAVALPAGLSACLLAWACLELLLQSGARSAGRTAVCLQPDLLLGGLIAWFAGAYFCRATDLASALPDAVRAIFLVTSKPLLAFGPFLVAYITALFAGAVTATAAHLHASRVPTLWAYVTANADTSIDRVTARERQVSQSIGDAVAEAATAQDSGVAFCPSDAQQQGGNVRVTAALPVLFAVHMLGAALVPAGWSALSLLHMCVANAAYVVVPAAEWLAASWPRAVGLALPRPCSHLPMRAYAAVHAVAMLAVYLTQSAVPDVARMMLTGECSVSLQRHVAPVLSMFLLATAHSALGQYLQAATGGVRPWRRLGEADQHHDGGEDDTVRVPLLRQHSRTSRGAAAQGRHAQFLEARWRPFIRGSSLVAAQGGPGSRSFARLACTTWFLGTSNLAPVCQPASMQLLPSCVLTNLVVCRLSSGGHCRRTDRPGVPRCRHRRSTVHALGMPCLPQTAQCQLANTQPACIARHTRTALRPAYLCTVRGHCQCPHFVQQKLQDSGSSGWHGLRCCATGSAASSWHPFCVPWHAIRSQVRFVPFPSIVAHCFQAAAQLPLTVALLTSSHAGHYLG